MQDFDEFLGRDLRLFGVDEEFIDKLKWMDRFVADSRDVTVHIRLASKSFARGVPLVRPRSSVGRRRILTHEC